MKLGNLNGLFDIRMEDIRLEKELIKGKKVEMLKEYAEAYKKLLENVINKINNLDETEKVKCTNDLIGNYYINDEGYINSTVKMTREGIKISLQFDNYSGKSFDRPEDYLDTDMNKMLEDENIHIRTNYGSMDTNPKITIFYKRKEDSNSSIDKTFDKKVKYLDECDKKVNEIYASAYVELVYNILKDIKEFNKRETISAKSPLIGDFYINNEGYTQSKACMVEDGLKVKLEFDDYANRHINKGDRYNEKLINEILKEFNIKIKTHAGICDLSNPSIDIKYIKPDEVKTILDSMFESKMALEYQRRQKIIEVNKKYAEAYINLISNVATNDINKTDTYQRISIKEPLFGNYYTKEDKYSSKGIMTDDGISITLEYDDYSEDRCYKRDKAYNEDIINELLKEDGVHIQTRSGHEGLDNTTTCIEFTRVINKGEKKLVK